MSYINYEQWQELPLHRDPFDFFVIPRLFKPEFHEELDRDFPPIAKGGSYPLVSVSGGPSFARLVDELRGDTFRQMIEQKFEVDLSGRPTAVTLRGQCRAKDGEIHADSRTKLVTVLVYMNMRFTGDGGHLRLLRNSFDLENYVAEIAPHMGTMVAFRCTPNAWHGHLRHVGERRSIQLNWLTDENVARREERRHRMSAMMKKLLPFG
jgi:hypothetical protein